jgi:hypothetical protein
LRAVALYVAHYNLCRVHEALRTTPAKALGVADKAWRVAQLVDAAFSVAPALPTKTPPDRRRKFTVIQEGGGVSHNYSLKTLAESMILILCHPRRFGWQTQLTI